ncbi:hypothetical protein C8Q70DRAFT_1039338 [Cubamyces menziesii]|nr:hypothetical protein C8Q70DRAFT_1039338 [Cubamyces menziesii]
MSPLAGPGCGAIRPASTLAVADAPASLLSRRRSRRHGETLTLTVVITIPDPSATASPSVTVPAALGIMSDITPTPTPRSPVDDYPAVDHIPASASSSSVNPSSLALRSGLAGGGAALLGTIIIAGILFAFHRAHRNRCKALRPRNPESEQRRSHEVVTPYPYGHYRENTPVFHPTPMLAPVDTDSRPPTYYSDIQDSPLPVELPVPAVARTRSRSIVQSVRRSPSAPTKVDLRPELSTGSRRWSAASCRVSIQ